MSLKIQFSSCKNCIARKSVPVLRTQHAERQLDNSWNRRCWFFLHILSFFLFHLLLSLFYFFCPPGQSPIYAVAHTEEREETVVTSNSNLLFLYISPPYFILHFVQVDIRMLCQKKSSMLQNSNLTKLKILSISVLSEASVRQRKVHSRVMQTAQTDECSTGKENRRDRPPRTDNLICL